MSAQRPAAGFMSDALWKQEYGCHLGSLSHRPSPLGGHLPRRHVHLSWLVAPGSASTSVSWRWRAAWTLSGPKCEACGTVWGLLTTCEAYMRRRISNGTSWNCWGRVMPWCNRRTLGATANTPLGTGQAVATMAGACCDSEWCSSAGMLGPPVPLGVLGRGPPRHQGEHLLLRQTVDSCVGTVRFPLLPLVEAAAGSVRLARRRRLCLWGLPATPAGGPGQGLQDRVLVELRSS